MAIAVYGDLLSQSDCRCGVLSWDLQSLVTEVFRVKVGILIGVPAAPPVGRPRRPARVTDMVMAALTQ